MVKNSDWKDTYTTKRYSNARYPSMAKNASGDGFAYIKTNDPNWFYDAYQKGNSVQVKVGGSWVLYFPGMCLDFLEK